MSAPDTNIKTQEKRHRGPLAGIRFVVGFAEAALLGLLVYLASQGNSPGTSQAPAVINID